MNKVIIFLLFAFFATAGCDTDEPVIFESTGEIRGFDARKCMCCGDWIIAIDGVDSLKEYRIEELPASSDIELTQTAEFPIQVKFNWTFKNECAGITRITIEDIERLNN